MHRQCHMQCTYIDQLACIHEAQFTDFLSPGKETSQASVWIEWKIDSVFDMQKANEQRHTLSSILQQKSGALMLKQELYQTWIGNIGIFTMFLGHSMSSFWSLISGKLRGVFWIILYWISFRVHKIALYIVTVTHIALAETVAVNVFMRHDW